MGTAPTRACRNGHHWRLQMKTKHLLSGVAVIAALALSAPVWAQPANPSGGNAVGVPGPNPGGPGLTPNSAGAAPPAPAPSANGAHGRMPAGGKKNIDKGGPYPGNLGDAPDAPSRASRHPRGRAPQDGGSDGIYCQSTEPRGTRPPSVR